MHYEEVPIKPPITAFDSKESGSSFKDKNPFIYANVFRCTDFNEERRLVITMVSFIYDYKTNKTC